jgi:hypothetical protein
MTVVPPEFDKILKSFEVVPSLLFIIVQHAPPVIFEFIKSKRDGFAKVFLIAIPHGVGNPLLVTCNDIAHHSPYIPDTNLTYYI